MRYISFIHMKYLTIYLLFITQFTLLGAKPTIERSSVAVLYNSSMPESKKLAEYYAQQRKIPVGNLIGLPMPKVGKISRADYNLTIRDPLRKHFTAANWWKLAKDPKQGITMAVHNKIHVLVCMYGVPYGVNQDPTMKLPKGKTPNAITKFNCASVDSELAVLSVDGVPEYSELKNRYFKQDVSFSQSGNTAYLLVGRIDGPGVDVCRTMIDDAIETEKTGLWGMSYLDLAYKGAGYQMGDNWITAIEKKNWSLGLPTTIDKNRDTYLANYPMLDVAMYFGWYTGAVNGPFRNPNFKFKKGAVAVHLHSYSASDLRNPNTKWTGPLIARGAAATVGNVYEPYLMGSHHFDVMHDRLMQGYTLVESAYMAIGLLSWQNVVIGDPLYQPYKHIVGSGKVSVEDKPYRASRMAFKVWGDDINTLVDKMRKAGIKAKDPKFFEIMGLFRRFQNRQADAKVFYNAAEKTYTKSSDKVRMVMHKIDLLMDTGQKSQAILACKAALISLKGDPSALVLKGRLNILSPPPPPPAQPNKTIPAKK